MRIITGTARGTKLETPAGEDTRPTGEKAKEGIFSAIQFDLHDRRVLDLFAGSGQLALEALSRGADTAVLADFSREACEIIKENARRAKLFERCRVVCSDWKDYIRGASGKDAFSLVFLDPPYAGDLVAKSLEALERGGLLTEDCIVIAETPADKLPPEIEGWESRRYRYGIAHVTIFRRISK